MLLVAMEEIQLTDVQGYDRGPPLSKLFYCTGHKSRRFMSANDLGRSGPSLRQQRQQLLTVVIEMVHANIKLQKHHLLLLEPWKDSVIGYIQVVAAAIRFNS